MYKILGDQDEKGNFFKDVISNLLLKYGKLLGDEETHMCCFFYSVVFSSSVLSQNRLFECLLPISLVKLSFYVDTFFLIVILGSALFLRSVACPSLVLFCVTGA